MEVFLVDQNGKFIGPDARARERKFVCLCFDMLTDLYQHLVTVLVANGIVNLFKVTDIKQYDGILLIFLTQLF